MIRGFYTAGSGIVTQEKKLNSISNNIANVRTVGYKRDDLIFGTFGEHLTVRKNAYQQTTHHPIGPGVYMQVVDEKYTNYTQGAFEETERPLDMSIMGEGYFVVADNNGNELLTRDGQFSIDEEGYLVLPGYGRVQGETGDIELESAYIAVDKLGNISVLDEEEGAYEEVDRLLIAIPDEDAEIEKAASGLFTISGYTEATDEQHPIIRQYQLERSNVNISDEMNNLIASQRALQSCSQIVKMYDEMADRITTQVSRV